jgi:hypothetical protein
LNQISFSQGLHVEVNISDEILLPAVKGATSSRTSDLLPPEVINLIPFPLSKDLVQRGAKINIQRSREGVVI